MKESLAEGIKAALLPELQHHRAEMQKLYTKFDVNDEKMRQHDKRMSQIDKEIEELRKENEERRRQNDKEITATRKENEERRRQNDKEIAATRKENEERRRQNDKEIAILRQEAAERWARSEERERAWHDTVMRMNEELAENRATARKAHAGVSNIMGHLDWGRRIERLERRIEEEILPRLPERSST